MSILSNWFGGSQQQAQQQETQEAQSMKSAQETQQPQLTPEQQLQAIAEVEAAPSEVFDPSKLFNMDPTKIQEEVGKMNFLEGAISKDQLAKVQEGGEGATVVLLEVMNNMARNLFARSAHLSTAVTSNALTSSVPHIQRMMGESVSETKLQDAIESVNPALATPVGKLFLKEFMPRLRTQHPKATHKELAEHANNMFVQFATQVNPAAPTPQQQQASRQTDWDAWLND